MVCIVQCGEGEGQTMRDATVSLRGWALRRRKKTNGFQIEVPPHLAVELGVCVLRPFAPKIIDCERPPDVAPPDERAKAA
jgi:hypothetical protein